MVELVFVYGTLKDSAIQKGVIGRVVIATPDTLKGYKKSVIEINNNRYPIVIPDSDSKDVIEGFVLELSSEELKKLDEYETDAYQRKKVSLVSGKQVWLYQK